jgi:multidrug transporter EmrE-like cation transporter
MTEEIQQAPTNKIEWRLLALTVLIFIVAEEALRHFAAPKNLETFILSSIALTLSRYISDRSESFARDALQSISITSFSFISFCLISPVLNNFMPVYLAYALLAFLFCMSVYAFGRIRKRQVSFSRHLILGLILGAIAGALGTFL